MNDYKHENIGKSLANMHKNSPAATGQWIDNAFFAFSNFKYQKIGLISQICSLSINREQGCTASNKKLGIMFRQSRGTASAAVSALERKKYIGVVIGDANNRSIYPLYRNMLADILFTTVGLPVDLIRYLVQALNIDGLKDSFDVFRLSLSLLDEKTLEAILVYFSRVYITTDSFKELQDKIDNTPNIIRQYIDKVLTTPRQSAKYYPTWVTDLTQSKKDNITLYLKIRQVQKLDTLYLKIRHVFGILTKSSDKLYKKRVQLYSKIRHLSSFSLHIENEIENKEEINNNSNNNKSQNPKIEINQNLLSNQNDKPTPTKKLKIDKQTVFEVAGEVSKNIESLEIKNTTPILPIQETVKNEVANNHNSDSDNEQQNEVPDFVKRNRAKAIANEAGLEVVEEKPKQDIDIEITIKSIDLFFKYLQSNQGVKDYILQTARIELTDDQLKNEIAKAVSFDTGEKGSLENKNTLKQIVVVQSNASYSKYVRRITFWLSNPMTKQRITQTSNTAQPIETNTTQSNTSPTPIVKAKKQAPTQVQVIELTNTSTNQEKRVRSLQMMLNDLKAGNKAYETLGGYAINVKNGLKASKLSAYQNQTLNYQNSIINIEQLVKDICIELVLDFYEGVTTYAKRGTDLRSEAKFLVSKIFNGKLAYQLSLIGLANALNCRMSCTSVFHKDEAFKGFNSGDIVKFLGQYNSFQLKKAKALKIDVSRHYAQRSNTNTSPVKKNTVATRKTFNKRNLGNKKNTGRHGKASISDLLKKMTNQKEQEKVSAKNQRYSRKRIKTGYDSIYDYCMAKGLNTDEISSTLSIEAKEEYETSSMKWHTFMSFEGYKKQHISNWLSQQT